MTSSDQAFGARVPDAFSPAPFAGYPYLVTRIGHSALRHMAILPADWSRARLVNLARRQASANRLETCLCFGPGDAFYLDADGRAEASDLVPTGIPVVERLALADPVPETAEVAARRRALRAYADEHTPGGYVVGDGLEGGRPATASDIQRLGRSGADGAPAGLARCPTCGEYAGEFLARSGEGNGDPTPRVVAVHCRCQNHNLCARFGEPLADRRLSAYRYDEADGRVWYVAAYVGLGHRCRSGAESTLAVSA